jgi:hypothetical protein
MHGIALNRQLGLGFADSYPLPIHRGRVCTRMESALASLKVTDEVVRIDTAVTELVSYRLARQHKAVGLPSPKNLPRHCLEVISPFLWAGLCGADQCACTALHPSKVATSSLRANHAE